jgi:hypothetical protein
MYVVGINLPQLVGSELMTFWKFYLTLYFNIMVAGQCILQIATSLI